MESKESVKPPNPSFMIKSFFISFDGIESKIIIEWPGENGDFRALFCPKSIVEIKKVIIVNVSFIGDLLYWHITAEH